MAEATHPDTRDRRARPRRVRRRVELERRDRAIAEQGRAGHGAGEPAPWDHRRRRLHRRGPRADRRSCARRRPLVRRRGDHERRHRREERRRPRLRGGLRPRGRRDPWRCRGGLEGQRPEQRARASDVPDRETAVRRRSSPSTRRRPATRSRAISPTEQAALIAATQRPVAELAFSEPNGPPAWKHLPSWAVVATGDRAAGTDVTRSMAERAGAKITEVDGLARDHGLAAARP